MIVKDDFLSKLRRHFDLNLYEVKLWTAILSRGVSTAGELSDIGEGPRSRSYDVLESLEKKGFVTMKLGKPIKYIAVQPEEVVDRAKRHMNIEAAEKVRMLEATRDSELMSELKTLFTQGINLVDPTELSGCMRGRHNLYNHIDFLVKEAKKSVNIMTTSAGLVRKVDHLRASLERAKKKGVKIRIAAPITKEHAELIQSLKDVAEIRHVENAKGRFCVVDGKDVVYTVLDDKEAHPNYDIGIWTKSPYFASAMDDYFNQTWQTGKVPK